MTPDPVLVPPVAPRGLLASGGQSEPPPVNPPSPPPDPDDPAPIDEPPGPIPVPPNPEPPPMQVSAIRSS